MLEGLMERHTGKKRTLRCVTGADGGGDTGEEARTAEEKAAKIGDLMGIKVRVDE